MAEAMASCCAAALSAEPYAAERRHQEHQAQEDEDVAGAHEHPVERRGQPGVECVEDAGGGVPERQYRGNECDDGEAGDDEDRVVDVKTEELNVVAPVLVVRLRGDGHAEPARRDVPDRSKIRLRLARPAGFEPATLGLEGRPSDR